MESEKAFIQYWDDAAMPEPGETQARDIAEAAFMAGRQSTAAPDLLAALEACACFWGSDALYDSPVAQQARAAINKAKGE